MTAAGRPVLIPGVLAGILLAAFLSAGGSASRADEPALRTEKARGHLEQATPQPLALARLYAAGRRADAVAQLQDWGEDELKRELIALRVEMGRMGGQLPERALQAAIMLHTDREAFERLQAPVVESARECGINEHGAYARALAALLVVQSDRARDFARRWLTAMALGSQWDLCLEDVRAWTREGLKWFPRDAELLLIQATAGEVLGSLMPVPEFFYANPSEQRRGLSEGAHRRHELQQARRDLEAALAIDPELHEARLRLGRVLWRLDKHEEARVALEAVLARSQDRTLLYLGHLFLGRLFEEARDLSAARERYGAALAIDPTAQAAAVALSEVLLLSGDDADAREVLGRALDHAPRRQPRDAYMSYHLGRSPLAEGLLEALRAETLE